jgi:RsiW-degrading membrane proteinase PrsW (M82 family)
MPVTVRNTDILFNDGTTQTTAAGAVTTAAVLNATAGASAGAVGTYYLRRSSGSSWSSGTTIAGSSMATGLSGTWRAMGGSVETAPSVQGQYGTTFYNCGIYLRIS